MQLREKKRWREMEGASVLINEIKGDTDYGRITEAI